MTLTRTEIWLSDDNRRVLRAVSQRTGLSMSALIRDAIHSTYGEVRERERIRELIDASFGSVVNEMPGELIVDGIRSGRRLSDESVEASIPVGRRGVSTGVLRQIQSAGAELPREWR